MRECPIIALELLRAHITSSIGQLDTLPSPYLLLVLVAFPLFTRGNENGRLENIFKVSTLESVFFFMRFRYCFCRFRVNERCIRKGKLPFWPKMFPCKRGLKHFMVQQNPSKSFHLILLRSNAHTQV